MDKATFHFHDELNDFLPRKQRQQPIERTFTWRASVKDMIESLGVPHAELELIMINGQGVTFEHIVNNDEDIHVYPRFDQVDHPNKVRLRPPLPAQPAFILDIHLGRLASYLRMLGFDTAYGDSTDHDEFLDPLLARTAHDEQRVMLTRDIGLLKRSLVTYGYWMRSKNPQKRLAEVVERFDLADKVSLFKRCMKCNGLLHQVDKEAVYDLLEPKTKLYYEKFHQCEDCKQVYWRGSHFKRMGKLISDVLPELASEYDD